VRRGWSPTFFRSLGVLYVLGRLKDGVPTRAAEADLTEISRRLSLADGFSTAGGWIARSVPLVDHHLGASTRQALQALGAASVFVLLLACANAAVLLLVQAIRDRSDLAVRRAVGASTADLVAQQVLDTSLLVAIGGAAGGLVAFGALRLVEALGPTGAPGLGGAFVSPGGFGLALATAAVTALGVALAPAWLASRLEVAPLLRAGRTGLDRHGVGLTRLLVASEVALSVVLLVGSGLVVRSLQNLLELDLGFVPERALTLSLDFAKEKYPTPRQDRAFHRAVVERLAALPGVESAGAIHNRPLASGPIGSDNRVIVEGDALDEASVTRHSLTVNWEAVTPDYFRAVGTRLVEGRGFSERDSAEAPRVVIVSRGLARRAWPGASPLGKRLHTYPAKAALKNGVYADIEWMSVVGVVEDARYRGLLDPRLDLYLPYGQVVDALHHVVVRTHGEPLAHADAVRGALGDLDADARVAEVTTLRRIVDRALAPWRLASGLLSAFALVALVLTASGLFAVLHHFVSGRTREIAIRMALGADAGRVRRFVLSQALAVTAVGIALGGAFSLALARALSALLYGIDARDPWSHLASVALIGLVAAGAALLPARRAARVDARVALRSD
jgi:predicted permease